MVLQLLTHDEPTESYAANLIEGQFVEEYDINPNKVRHTYMHHKANGAEQ
jgi:hypothetical protein